MQKIVSVAVIAAMLFSCVSSLSVSAADLSDDDAYLYYDGLRMLKEYYELDTSIDIETDVCYLYGRENGGTGNPIGALWIGGKGYRYKYVETAEEPYYSYSMSSSSSPMYGSQYTGHGYLALFYYATDSNLLLLAGQTTNLTGFNTMVKYSDAPTYSTAVSLDEFLAAIEPVEPTEPITTDAPPFTLPPAWIDGGNTLPDATAETFEGIDPDKAFDEFNSAVDNADDVISDASFVNSIGLFWQIVIDFITTLDIWAYVILAMILGIMYWLLGR